MKIAVASNNGDTVAQHFGRARRFEVLTVEDGAVTGRETRGATGRHGTEGAEHEGHGGGCQQALAAVADCDVLIVGGMGGGAFARCRRAGLEPVLTDARRVEEAALRYARGDLPNLEGRLHVEGHGAGHGHDHDD